MQDDVSRRHVSMRAAMTWRVEFALGGGQIECFRAVIIYHKRIRDGNLNTGCTGLAHVYDKGGQRSSE